MGDQQMWIVPDARNYKTGNTCLDLPGGNTQNGQAIWIWDCNGGNNQRWGYNSDTGGIFYADDLSKCIDAGNVNNGAPLMIWDCNQQPQQQWTMPSLINGEDREWQYRFNSSFMEFDSFE